MHRADMAEVWIRLQSPRLVELRHARSYGIFKFRLLAAYTFTDVLAVTSVFGRSNTTSGVVACQVTL
jgi:hypothetical protein